ncbi:type IV pilus modification PilV family protein [Paenibacillus agricola]|uniref:Type II secretion system protein n=1 Tax=Paenibacillus agricola TaxID=2716264 RepID=A0ABX0J9R8_9BACL|nr:type II secretion system protein [Paenibacillus agricola]NHN30731.1 type II secretion system protein [Paenibacillus agricola]
MNNQKGLSLLEVLAAVTILAMVILSISYFFTKNYEYSNREESKDISVNVARNVIEDLKPGLMNGTAVTLFSNSEAAHALALNEIELLRDNQDNTFTFDYITDPISHLKVAIREINIPNNRTYTITDELNTEIRFPFVMNHYFSHIEVTVTDTLLNNTTYTLQSYLEKRPR